MPLSSIDNQNSVKKDEGDFMNSLLAGLDETFFASPTPTPSSSGSTKLLSWTPTPRRPSQTVARRSCGAEIIRITQSPTSSKRVLSSPTKSSVNKKRQARSSFPSSFNAPSPSPKIHFGKTKTPFSNSQAKVIAEDDHKAANELLLASDDWDNFEPSPKKVVSLPKINRAEGSEKSTLVAQGKTSERYVRCLVDFVSRSTYIPERYRMAPEGKQTTKGVKAETVDKIMRRDQLVLDLKVLERKGEEGKILSQRRKVYLRDEWLQTHILPGNIVHLIGTWITPSGSEVNIPKRVEVTLEGESEEEFDLTPESPKYPFMILSSDTFIISSDGKCEADNLIILHPDILLSATAISSVVSCARKPLIQAKIKQSGPGIEDKPTEALVMGRMLHEVLQSCLTGNGKELPESFKEDVQEHTFQAPSTFPQIWNGPEPTNFSEQFVKRQIAVQVRTSLDDLLHAGLDTVKSIERLWEATLPFGPFATIYLGKPPPSSIPIETNPLAEAIDSRSAFAPLVRVLQIHDVEEDIWSPMYGLKGFVDVSVQVQVTERGSDGKNVPKRADSISAFSTTTIMMPLELKTGRSINMIEHRAQTMLYTLMMSDRYRRQINCGLLYYSKSGELHMVRTARNEVRGLLLARNELARYMARREGNKEEEAVQSVIKHQERAELPPTIDDERTCSRCYVSDACMLYQKAANSVEGKEEKTDQESEQWALSSLYERHTSHLSAKHATFFNYWNHLLTLEEADVVKHRREMWTMTAEARESAGRCYANMVLSRRMPTKSQKDKVSIQLTNGMNKCILYGFKRAKTSKEILLGGNLSVGDAICVSIEPSLISIAQGFLLELSPHHILVGLDRSLEQILKRAGENQRQAIFRIDREEQVSGMARIRYNLAKLFFAPPAGDARRRDLIVDLRKPTFVDDSVVNTQSLKQLEEDLNVDQINAIHKVLSAEDYALIVGMPGTGKTTTIAKLITLLARKGKSVLLASYTHSAVDTICRKLIDVEGVNLLRLGNSDRVHLDVQNNMLKQSSTVEQLQASLLEPNVVATTCLSIGHALFALRNSFDYCIVDEASQITLPACIGPLRYAHKFVLVGDPHQLPPLVKDFRARQEGLDVSLFEHLQRAHPHAVVHLCHQYRMNADIMSLSNALTYQGRLQCGNENVKLSTVSVPELDKSIELMHSHQTFSTCNQQEDQCWIQRALSDHSRALFINTNQAKAYEQRTGELVENLFEAKMVWQLCFALISAGVDAKEIAILTPYRQQIRRISALLHQPEQQQQEIEDSLDHNTPTLTTIEEEFNKIEVWTADKAQGRDKDVVIVSLVRSKDHVKSDSEGDSTSVGQLLHDVRRINVALTRARKKLIILGDRNTLSNAPTLAKLWTIMHQKGWTFDLTENQLNCHKECLDKNQFIPPHPPTSSPTAFFSST